MRCTCCRKPALRNPQPEPTWITASQFRISSSCFDAAALCNFHLLHALLVFIHSSPFPDRRTINHKVPDSLAACTKMCERGCSVLTIARLHISTNRNPELALGSIVYPLPFWDFQSSRDDLTSFSACVSSHRTRVFCRFSFIWCPRSSIS